MSKDVFKDKLQYGDEEWEHLPYNFQDGQPCPNGCILKRRLKPPFDYHLVGDCRVPSDPNCCMNKQDKMMADADKIIANIRERMNDGHS